MTEELKIPKGYKGATLFERKIWYLFDEGDKDRIIWVDALEFQKAASLEEEWVFNDQDYEM